jgi:hypothetical protein
MRAPPGTRTVVTRVLISLSALAGLGLASPRCFAQEISDDWQFGLTIYGWFPDIGGETRFPLGGDQTIDIDISTILDNLKMTAQASFEVHKGRWGGFTDVVYLDVGASKSQTRNLEFNGNPLPAAVTADVDLDVKSTIWTVAASYRAVASSSATLDFLFGARLADMQQNLEWEFSGSFGATTPPPITGGRDTSVDQWDFIAGAKGRLAFGPEQKWQVPYYFDMGSGDSDLTWQGMVGLAYAFGWGDLGVAWRYLDYDLGDAAIAEMNFNGPALGATFRW